MITYQPRHSYLILLVLLVIICGCATVLKSAKRSPRKSVHLWNNALYSGNIERAKLLTSKQSKEYVDKAFNGIEGLSEIYKRNKKNRGKTTYESVNINDNVATVTYVTKYKDGSIKKWSDKLFKEDGIWKVAPEFVKTTVIRNVGLELEEIQEEDKKFLVVEQQPEPKRGFQAFNKYIATHIIYPEQARRAGVQGKVYVQFVVEKDGSITDVKAIKGIGTGCDQEAVKVVRNSPKWIPGKHRGRPVRVRMVIPLLFTL